MPFQHRQKTDMQGLEQANANSTPDSFLETALQELTQWSLPGVEFQQPQVGPAQPVSEHAQGTTNPIHRPTSIPVAQPADEAWDNPNVLTSLKHLPKSVRDELTPVIWSLMPSLAARRAILDLVSPLSQNKHAEGIAIYEVAHQLVTHRYSFQRTQGHTSVPSEQFPEALTFAEELHQRMQTLIPIFQGRDLSNSWIKHALMAIGSISFAQFAMGRQHAFPETVLHSHEVLQLGFTQMPVDTSAKDLLETAIVLWGHDCKMTEPVDNLITHPVCSAAISEAAMIGINLRATDITWALNYNLDSGFVASLIANNFLPGGSQGIGQFARATAQELMDTYDRLSSGGEATPEERRLMAMYPHLMDEVVKRINGSDDDKAFHPDHLLLECQHLIYEYGAHHRTSFPLWFEECLQDISFETGLVSKDHHPIRLSARACLIGLQDIPEGKAQDFALILGYTDALTLRVTKIYSAPCNGNWPRTFSSYLLQSLPGNYKILPDAVKNQYLRGIALQIAEMFHALREFDQLPESWIHHGYEAFRTALQSNQPLDAFVQASHVLGNEEFWGPLADDFDTVAPVITRMYDSLTHRILQSWQALIPDNKDPQGETATVTVSPHPSARPSTSTNVIKKHS